jgi:tetratricopeptide (TPR) repeat protein
VEQNPHSAIEQYKASLRLNPYVSQCWLDLAVADQIVGDTTELDHSLSRAIQVDPTTPAVAWEAANLYLVAGKVPDALREFRVVIEQDPENSDTAIQLCWRRTHDINKMLNEALPETADSYFAFLELLANEKEFDAARKVWSRLLDLRQSWDASRSFPFLRSLLLGRQVETAAQAWREMSAANPLLVPYQPSDNLIVDGGFEFPFLNGGFDWIYEPDPVAKVTIEATTVHSGRHSLSVEFTGEPGGDIGVSEYVAVMPGVHYEFSGYLMSENIEGSSGPRIAIQDAYKNDDYFLSDDLIGSHPWVQIRSEFQTGPDTSLLRLKVVRNPADRRIRGKLWIDDLRITKKSKTDRDGRG